MHTSPKSTIRATKARNSRRKRATINASVQALVARRLAAAQLDRRADAMLIANLPAVAERLSTAAAALREGWR